MAEQGKPKNPPRGSYMWVEPMRPPAKKKMSSRDKIRKLRKTQPEYRGANRA